MRRDDGISAYQARNLRKAGVDDPRGIWGANFFEQLGTGNFGK